MILDPLQYFHHVLLEIFDAAGQIPYIIFEFVEGKSLATLIIEGHRFEFARLCELMAAVADGLQHAHEAGIVHRDVEPGNVIVGRDGRRQETHLVQAALFPATLGKQQVSVMHRIERSAEQSQSHCVGSVACSRILWMADYSFVFSGFHYLIVSYAAPAFET